MTRLKKWLGRTAVGCVVFSALVCVGCETESNGVLGDFLLDFVLSLTAALAL
jgi:hypothetical protein